MKLVNAKNQIQILLVENMVNVLVIEQPQIYTEVVGSLYRQCNGENGEFVLSESEKELKISQNMEIVIDLYALDLNNRKIINRLYKELTELGNDYQNEKNKINAEIIKVLDDIFFQSQYNNIISCLDFDWMGIFKLYDVKLDTMYSTIKEKVLEYIKILSNICDISILCLVNIKSYLTDFELRELYEMAFYCKIQLLLIESHEMIYNEYEKVIIIDKDNCLIEK